MRKFGSDPHEFFDSIYQDRPPWDIGDVQPALQELFDAYSPADPILDVGCGAGDLVIALASRGLHVTAINQAQENLVPQTPEVRQKAEFLVADALNLAHLQRQFGTVVDSGFFHVLDPDQRDAFIQELSNVLRLGGRYYLLAFTVDFGLPNTPYAISIEEIRERFSSAAGWQIHDLQTAEFHNRIAAPVPALRACIERISIP